MLGDALDDLCIDGVTGIKLADRVIQFLDGLVLGVFQSVVFLHRSEEVLDVVGGRIDAGPY